MQFDVTRVNDGLGGILLALLHWDHVHDFVLPRLCLGSEGIVDALEHTDDLVADKRSVAEDLDMGGSGQFLDSLVLCEHSLSGWVVGVSVLHPVDREQVAQAGSNLDSIDNVLWGTVRSPRAFSGVGGSHGGDVDVVLEIWEH